MIKTSKCREEKLFCCKKRQKLMENSKKINNKVTSNKTKHVENEKKLNDMITKLINDLMREVTITSKKKKKKKKNK